VAPGHTTFAPLKSEEKKKKLQRGGESGQEGISTTKQGSAGILDRGVGNKKRKGGSGGDVSQWERKYHEEGCFKSWREGRRKTKKGGKEARKANQKKTGGMVRGNVSVI